MEHVTVDDIEPSPSAGDAVRRALTDALGTTDVAINQYRIEPGERISGLHGHDDQEEVFVVVDGTVTFETLDGELTVDSGGAIRFAPGEYQSGMNSSDGSALVYAIGAPRDSGDVRIPLACPECGHEFVHPTLADDGETPILACPGCGAESTVECPECGGVDLTATLGDDGETPVSRCRDCGATFEGARAA